MSELIEESKKQAAYAAVNENVRSGMKLGIGSGSTVVYVVERIAHLVKNEGLSIKACVPTSFQSIELIEKAGLPLGTVLEHPELDLAIDGADEVDDQLNLIKGGGGCQLQEKIVASCASKFVVVADYRKNSSKLGQQWKQGVPLEVLPLAFKSVELKLKKLNGKPKLRMSDPKSKAGPVVTDNGNFILDTDFGVIDDPIALELKLKSIPGIIESGLFIKMATKAYFGNKDGTVTIR